METGPKFTTLPQDNNISNLNKRLSVQVSLNGLSFLATDQSGRTLFFEDFKLSHSTTPEELLLELEKIVQANPIFMREFSNISVVYATSIYALVPFSLFDESRASEYLKFNSKILANDYIAHDFLEEHNVVVVYVPFMNINNYLFEKFGSFSYYHSITILLKTILSKEKYSLPRIYLHIGADSFDCIVLKNRELQLCNSYSYKTPEDFIYYVLFCMQQLQLDPETVEVVLCGEIDKDDELYQIAYTYIRNITFVDERMVSLSIEGDDKIHHHFTLKNSI